MLAVRCFFAAILFAHSDVLKIFFFGKMLQSQNQNYCNGKGNFLHYWQKLEVITGVIEVKATIKNKKTNNAQEFE
jgi:hypothetical protein